MARSSKYTVGVEITGRDAGAGAAAQQVEGRFSSLRGLMDRFVVTAGDIVGAIRSVVGSLGEMFSAASEAERNQARLVDALERQGAASPAVVSALNAQADAIAKVSGLTDNQVSATQALLAQMGVAASQIPAATQASADLAAALGISLESATRNVGKTVGGFAGELGELIPELKGFTAEQLRAGEGIDFLAQKFSGSLAKSSGDLTTQFQGMRNDLAELGEAFARGALASDGLNSSLTTTRETLQQLEPTAVAIGAAFGKLVNVLASVQNGFISLQNFGTRVSDTLFSLFDSGRQLELTGEAAERTGLQINAAGVAVFGAGEAAEGSAPKLRNLAEAAAAAGDQIAGVAPKTQVAVDTLAAYTAALEASGVKVIDVAAKQASLEAALVATEAAARAGTITEQQRAASVAAINAALDELIGKQSAAAESALSATDAYDAQAVSLGRVAESAGAAADGLERLASAQRAGLDGLRGEAAGISLEEIRRLQGRLGGGFQSGAGLGGGAGGSGFGGAVRVRPDGTRSIA